MVASSGRVRGWGNLVLSQQTPGGTYGNQTYLTPSLWDHHLDFIASLEAAAEYKMGLHWCKFSSWKNAFESPPLLFHSKRITLGQLVMVNVEFEFLIAEQETWTLPSSSSAINTLTFRLERQTPHQHDSQSKPGNISIDQYEIWIVQGHPSRLWLHSAAHFWHL